MEGPSHFGIVSRPGREAVYEMCLRPKDFLLGDMPGIYRMQPSRKFLLCDEESRRGLGSFATASAPVRAARAALWRDR